MIEIQKWETPSVLASILNKAGIPYQFTGPAALVIQGVKLMNLNEWTLEIQWDLLETAYTLLSDYKPSVNNKDEKKASFSFELNSEKVSIECIFNTTIRTNPYRIMAAYQETDIWCLSLYYYLFDILTEEEMKDKIHSYLLDQQNGVTEVNNRAWNQHNYLALINRFGEPADAARKIKQNPEWRLHPFYKYMGKVEGKKILHLMGSNGVKGTALACLGAEVTIVDFSRENEKFANELAASAGIELKYIVSDVLNLPDSIKTNEYDIVIMELGVLHYFIDLQPLCKVIKTHLKPAGQFLLHEFHPVSTKLITSSGKKHKVTGNYFDPALESHEVAFSKHMEESIQPELKKVWQRKWTLGEIITSVGQSGLRITQLEEEPNHKVHDIGLPKTYTLLAVKD
ncbi:class I SAM-dependent methyltransferase [Heyndrickxia acidicola]|uniref:Methyltransferase domain-containing protein n=1 Tax=Heyndrickxia acidicola TaxID=209389 RepID=A0ABU6MBT4_9BACI|nr:methyltransferase domain-containing protein [Heyndrickxia acidicola]MED1201734.1 methyltransferase domain-containing protein [Heyndrickxia acidicola]